MLGIHMELRGDINLDKFEVDVHCPRCDFYNPIWIKQARLRDTIICRGCKANIRLDDSMNTVRKAVRGLREQLASFRREIERINRRFR